MLTDNNFGIQQHSKRSLKNSMLNFMALISIAMPNMALIGIVSLVIKEYTMPINAISGIKWGVNTLDLDLQDSRFWCNQGVLE